VTRRFWLLTAILASLWGASYLFIKIGLRDLSPAWVVFARTALAALVLVPIARRRGALRGLARIWPGIAVLGAIQVAGPFLLITFGERHIASSLAGILVASVPVFTAMLAPFLDHSERSHGWSLVGVLVGLVGVALLLGVDVGGDSAALAGALMVLLASAGYAVGGFMLKRSYREVPPTGLVTGTMAASAILTLPWALATLPSDAPGLGPIAAVFVLGVGGTGIAFVIFYTLIAGVGPAKAAVVSYIAPGFAVFYGVAFLDENVTLGTFAGLVLILLGSWMAAGGRLPRRVQAAAAAGGAPAPCEEPVRSRLSLRPPPASRR
jgi:drug/metabolite transporter (DMT)-like permease